MCFQGNKRWSLRTLKWSSIVNMCPHLFDRNTRFLLHLRDICTSSETPQEPYRNNRLVKHILEFGSICWINFNVRYIVCSLQYMVCISNIPLFRWCWGLLDRYSTSNVWFYIGLNIFKEIKTLMEITEMGLCLWECQCWCVISVLVRL